MILFIRRRTYKIKSSIMRFLSKKKVSKKTRRAIMRKVKKVLRKYKMIIKR